LLLYQDLIRFHLSDKNPEALIDLDLSRLQFIYEHAVIEDKNNLYLKSLTNIRNRYNADPGSAQAVFLKASKEIEIAMAGENNIGNSDSKFALSKIKKDCEQIALQFPESEGGLNGKRILQELDKKTLSLVMEKINLPNQPMRCLVGFKNISTIYYRIIQVTEQIESSLIDRWNNKYWSFLKEQKFLKENKQILPQIADLRNHTAEIKIDGLAPGRYVLLASGDQSFSINKNPLSAQYFYVSQIAYINRGNDYFVLNRESGKPLQQADVAIWTQTYDYAQRKYQVVKRTSLKTDLDGYFKMPVIGKNNEPVRLEINIKGDRLFLDDTEYRSYSENKTETTDQEEYEEDQRKLFLFTDRSIYRPGQTVYFKGIIITRDFTTKKFKVVSGYTSKIE
ncbi:MAG: hypothetical protein ACRC2O_06755, partial [Chitinophagaceae bacterium]